MKHSHVSSSPQSASKRLPGSNQLTSANSAGGSTSSHLGVAANSANNAMHKGPLSRARKDAQRPGEQSARLQRQSTRTMPLEHNGRMLKKSPEPYVKTTSHILKKFAKSPPSLIVHLYPTHFRFEQQDGSFPYNSEMKVIIEHIRAGTVPHDMVEELLRAGVRFYEGCLIVRVVDHKSVSTQAGKSSASSSDDKNEPFSIHNYNEHVTPSAFVPYPKHNQLSEKQASKTDAETSNSSDSQKNEGQFAETVTSTSHKVSAPKPRVFTTVLHPTPRSMQAELTLLATTPDPRAVNRKQPTHLHTSSSALPQSPAIPTDTTDSGHVTKRQKMLVESQDLIECESKLTRALAPPLFLEPVDSLDAVHDLLKFMESPLHRDKPPSPKRRKRTVAELAADEALAAEEERFMLIMDERLGPTANGVSGGPKPGGVDESGGAAAFEPRFARFKTLENIRMQHEEKAKREHELKIKQELAKRQAQEQERERRRAIEQRQAEEHAKEEARRQQLAAQQAQAQLTAQQQSRHVLAQANSVGQRQQTSPVVRNQTPQSISSPLVGNVMATRGGVPMSITASAGSPQRPPSALQHAHPNVMGHPMAPTTSQQSRNGTPQMTHGTPAMSHTTPVMRNATPTQRMSHGSPTHSTMAPTPVTTHSMMGTPQMGNGMGLTPQQQYLMQQRQQQLLAQQRHLASHGQFSPQQMAQIQANSQAIRQQQILQAQQNQQSQMQNFQNPQQQQAYQAQIMRAQLAQLQMAQHQQQHQTQNQQNQIHQSNPQMTPQQQQMLMAAAQANGGHVPQNFQGHSWALRYQTLYEQKLLQLRSDMAKKYMGQYGPPTQYPPQVAQQYNAGLEQAAKAWIQEYMRRDAQQRQRAVQAQILQQQQQQQQQNMMQSGMNK